MNDSTTPTFTLNFTLAPTLSSNESQCFTKENIITGCNHTICADGCNYTVCADESQRPLPLLIFMGLAFSIIIAASICGNLLVVFAVYKNLRLRSKTNFFIVSLATADLLVAILAMTFSASDLIAEEVTWSTAGPFFCKFWLASDIFFSTASTLHLCAIAVDRYMAILHPFRYVDIMNKRMVWTFLATIWILSANLAYVPIYTDLYVLKCKEIRLGTMIKKCDLEPSAVYAIVSSCITFWIPGITMSAIYFRVFREANRQERAISSERKRLQSQIQQNYSFKKERMGDSNQNLSLPPTPELPGRERKDTATDSINRGRERGERGSQMERKLHRERKAARTLAIIMGVFLLCWLPFFTCYTSNYVFRGGNMITAENGWVMDLFIWMGYLNSSLNPVIYAYFNRDFRQAFKKLLHSEAVSAAMSGVFDVCRRLPGRGSVGGGGGRKNDDNGFAAQHNPLQPLQDNSSG